ncbi:MAG: molybdopterin dinucleotide binding domain-containing protein [Planctomycetota bacterium]
MWLTTGRRLAHYHTRTMTGRSVGSDWLVPEELVEIHPDDVARLGLEHGGLAVLSSRRGEVVVKVEATTKSPRGTVFCSFSFGDVRINDLTGGGYDPMTDTAELKVCPVRVEKASGALV